MDVRLGRSINQFSMSVLLSIFNEQDESSIPWSAHLPRLMDFKCGRSIKYSIQFIQILDNTVDEDKPNV